MGLRNIFGEVSDAIPNEFSKLASFGKFLPPPFNVMVTAPAAVDNFGETYSNGGSVMDSISHGMNGFMGNSADPNYFSPKNHGKDSDSFLKVGRIGNLIPSTGGGFQNSGSVGSGGQLSNLFQMFGGSNNYGYGGLR